MWNKNLTTILAMSALAIGTPVDGAAEDEASGAAVGKYLPMATVTLQQGLTAAESRGKPISGKLIAACAISTTRSLQSAVDQAATGYRAVSVTPKLSNGHAVAVVQLLKGSQVKSVSEPLE